MMVCYWLKKTDCCTSKVKYNHVQCQTLKRHKFLKMGGAKVQCYSKISNIVKDW